MTWADIYLICFLVGFALSLLSFVTGGAHVHLPHLHLHLHLPHVHIGEVHGGEEIPFFNFGTICAFLTAFGGTGFLLSRYSTLGFVVALGISAMTGLGGAAIIFYVLAKVLMRSDEEMDPADYEMIGVLGTVTSKIRPGGTGEMIFSREGARRAAPVRSDEGAAIEKGVEVVVTRYEKGIAYVRRWEDLANADSSGWEERKL